MAWLRGGIGPGWEVGALMWRAFTFESIYAYFD